MSLALVQSLFKVYLSSNSRACKQLEPALLPVLCPAQGYCVGPLHWLIQHSHWEKNSPPSEKEGWRSVEEKKKKGIKMNSKPSKRYPSHSSLQTSHAWVPTVRFFYRWRSFESSLRCSIFLLFSPSTSFIPLPAHSSLNNLNATSYTSFSAV